jgi:gliding motility-associated lipoprotein GldB
MKTYVFILVFCLSFLSCDKKSKLEKKIETIPVKLHITRFDQLFFETTPENFNVLKNKFPVFFPKNTPDAVWLEKMQNPQWRELYTEVQKKYSKIDSVKTDLETLFKHQKYYFPDFKTPKVVTVIAEMDYNRKVIYTDSLLVISLELYLGKNHKFYEFPKYLKQNFEEKQIAADVVSAFSIQKIAPATDKTFLSQMIYYGKQLYLKDLLLPKYSDADKMGYTPEQTIWCQENESYMWRYFISKEMLYSSDQKLVTRFINPAPFSKFYLEIDNESPGQVGSWLGWQMVRAYMSNNEVSLTDLLNANAKEIFEKSKYKPKKNDE